jgi:hypothetical protein
MICAQCQARAALPAEAVAVRLLGLALGADHGRFIGAKS